MTATSTVRGQLVAYMRVSSVDQNTLRQEEAIDALNPDRKFVDHCSGRDVERPEWKKCSAYLREGDTLVVHSIDRLCRNVCDLLTIAKGLKARGINIRFIKEGIDTSSDNPMNAFLLTIIGAVAEFERALIKERQREGIVIAKASGKFLGRKPLLNEDQKEEARSRKAAGENIASIARRFNVSRSVIYSALAETR